MSVAKLLFAAALVTLAIGAKPAPVGPAIIIYGRTLKTRPAPVIRRGRIYVPITAFREMGLQVTWKRGQSSGTVAWEDSDLIYDVTAGRSWVPGQIAGSKIKIPGMPYMCGDQLMVPLRTPVIDMPQYRDFQIRWDSRHRAAIIRKTKWCRNRKCAAGGFVESKDDT